jgi:hypothetical protein
MVCACAWVCVIVERAAVPSALAERGAQADGDSVRMGNRSRAGGRALVSRQFRPLGNKALRDYGPTQFVHFRLPLSTRATQHQADRSTRQPEPRKTTHRSGNGPVFKNSKTAAPREGVRVTRADFVHLIRGW